MTIKHIGNNDWRLDVTIRLHGKQYRRRENVAGKRDAMKRHREIISELENKGEEEYRRLNAHFTTFGECLEFYIRNTPVELYNCRHPLKVLRKHIYNASLDNLQYFYDTFMLKMRSKISYRGKKYSSGTLNRFSQRIRAIVFFCKKKRVISNDVSIHISLFKEVPRTRVLTMDEKDKFINTIKEYASYLCPIVNYAFQVPSRRNELVKMQRNWVDLNNKCIKIPPEFMKNGRLCIKPIPPDMIEYFSCLPDETEYVFYRIDKGEHKPIKDFRGSWDLCCSKAGISDFRFHDTRHMAASALVLKGISEREVMQVAGWSTNMLSTYFNNSGLSAVNSVFEALKK